MVLPCASPALAVAHDTIQGSGSSWAANAINQWIADTTQSGLQVIYNPSGSSSGRSDFANNVTQYSDSDVAYGATVDPSTQQTDAPGSRAFSYLPVVAGGTSFPYHLTVAGQLVTNLRLSPLTLAKVFTNQITNWNDPAITQDNNGRSFPSIPIIPVVRSDGSGATAQFTLYLDSVEPATWRPYFGQSGGTSFWPRKDPQIGQYGSDGVINYLTSSAGQGAIAFDEYSYALQKQYPVVKLENPAGFYTLPTQYNVAVALTQAQINTTDPTNYKTYLTQNLSQVYTYNDPRSYPLSSYSYFIVPTGGPQNPPQDTKMTTGARQTLADYLYYSLCQGQREMGPLGYSPLPRNLVQASFDQVTKLKTADGGVDLTSRDITTCQNPTFDPANPSANLLAELAPQPATCDMTGQGPCTNGAAAAANANPVTQTVTTKTAAGKTITKTKAVAPAAKSKSTTNVGKSTASTSAGLAGAVAGAGSTAQGVTGGTAIAATGSGTTGGATAPTTGTVDPLTGVSTGNASGDPAATTGDQAVGAASDGSAVAAFPVATVLSTGGSATPTKVLLPLIILLLVGCLVAPPFISARLGSSKKNVS